MDQNMWRKLRLICPGYEQLIMDGFHCAFKSTDNLTSVLTGFMISLFLAASSPRVRRAWNLMEISVPDSLRLFCLWKTTILNWSWSRTLTFKKVFAKLKFSPALFEKLLSFVCLVFKIENKWILKLQNLFS